MPRKKKEQYIEKDKWNELLPDGNGFCTIHDFKYWHGRSDLRPNIIGGSNCPECEFAQFGKYSEMTKELYKDVRNQEESKSETTQDNE